MIIFNGVPPTAPAAAVPTTALLIVAERIVFDMEITSTADGRLDWHMEFTSDDPLSPAARWYREVSEDDMGGGVVDMPAVARNYVVTGAAVTRLSAQFVRAHRFVRLQLQQTAAAGISRVRIEAPFGQAVLSPVS